MRNGSATGVRDINGEMIRIGDMVSMGDYVGRVTYKNAAIRVALLDGDLLRYNSSLLFSESGKRFEIIAKG